MEQVGNENLDNKTEKAYFCKMCKQINFLCKIRLFIIQKKNSDSNDIVREHMQRYEK
jgi:hypothetical protein